MREFSIIKSAERWQNNMIRNKNCLQYYYILRGLFPNVGYAEGKFLRDVKMQLRDYSLIHYDCTFEDVIANFGSPEDIVKDYLSNQQPQVLYQSVLLSRKKQMLIFAGVLAIFITAVAVVFCYYRAYQNFLLYEPTIVETTIDGGTVTP